MDEMKSLVLEVKEGRGFDNITDGIIIEACVNGVTCKTSPARITREGNIHFNNELIWDLPKKYLRRMRISSAGLKIECFAVRNKDKRFRIGYTSLKLKSIKEVRNGDEVDGKWMKLLGVTVDYKHSIPSVLLKLYLQDSVTREETDLKISSSLELNLTPRLTNVKGMIEIGPTDDKTPNFLLGLKITEMKNLSVLSPEGFIINEGFYFMYTLFGFEVKTDIFKDLSVQSLQEKIVIKLRTTISFLRSYLESNPSLIIRLLSKDTIFGLTKVDLRTLLPENGISDLPILVENHVNLLSAAISENKDEPSICLLTSLSILDEDENSSAAAASFMSQKGDSNLESITSPKNDTVSKGNTRGVTSPSTTKKVKKNEEFSPPQPENSKKSSVNSKKANDKPYVDDAIMYKVVRELEDWKDKQMDIFIDKMKHKEKKHLDLLSDEWSIKRERLEGNLSKVIRQNEILMATLKDALSDLQERKNRVDEKDKLLKFLKDDLERSYNQKLHDLKLTSKRMEDDYKHKVEMLERQNQEQEFKFLQLERECGILKEKVKELEEERNRTMRSAIVNDQTALLLNEVKSLQEKLEVSSKSEAFFKEEWAKAMREIQQLKTMQQESLQLRRKTNKEELNDIGPNRGSSGENNDRVQEPRVFWETKKWCTACDSGDESNKCCSKSLPRQFKPQPTINVNEENLQKLIEERNSLLRTGSYSIGDEVISQLNHQIRSIMTNQELVFDETFSPR